MTMEGWKKAKEIFFFLGWKKSEKTKNKNRKKERFANLQIILNLSFFFLNLHLRTPFFRSPFPHSLSLKFPPHVSNSLFSRSNEKTRFRLCNGEMHILWAFPSRILWIFQFVKRKSPPSPSFLPLPFYLPSINRLPLPHAHKTPAALVGTFRFTFHKKFILPFFRAPDRFSL